MIRDIKIKAVLNGFIIECGCQTLVCEDVDKMTNELNEYFRNPNEVEKKWIRDSINSNYVGGIIRGEEPEQIQDYRASSTCNTGNAQHRAYKEITAEETPIRSRLV